MTALCPVCGWWMTKTLTNFTCDGNAGKHHKYTVTGPASAMLFEPTNLTAVPTDLTGWTITDYSHYSKGTFYSGGTYALTTDMVYVLKNLMHNQKSKGLPYAEKSVPPTDDLPAPVPRVNYLGSK